MILELVFSRFVLSYHIEVLVDNLQITKCIYVALDKGINIYSQSKFGISHSRITENHGRAVEFPFLPIDHPLDGLDKAQPRIEMILISIQIRSIQLLSFFIVFGKRL